MSARSIVLKMFALVVLLTVSGSHRRPGPIYSPEDQVERNHDSSRRCLAGESECRPRQHERPGRHGR